MIDTDLPQSAINRLTVTEKAERSQRRFESRSELPPLLELKATVVHPDSQEIKASRESIAYWVGNPTTDFTKSRQEPFIAPQKPGAWMTNRSRSVYVPKEKGYLQIKGTGNFDKPNFPPIINLHDRDIGHQYIWSVGAGETATVILFSRLFDQVGIQFTSLQKAVKLSEIPVPINDRGGLEIRTVYDALLKPWEYADHVRKHMLQQLRELLTQKYDIPSDLPDETFVLFFQNQEGFCQLHIEQQLPFRNDIGSLINMPILLDYLSGNNIFSLKSQAEKVVWVFHELGRLFNISELENVMLPDITDMVEPVEKIFDKNSFDGLAKQLDFRRFFNATTDGMSENNIRLLKKHYKIPEGEPLLQINSTLLIEKILAQIPDSQLKRMNKEISSYQEQLALNYIKAVTSGMSLSQSVGSKDAILGKVGDIAAAGVPKKNIEDLDQFAEYLRTAMISDEEMCLGSYLDLSAIIYGKQVWNNLYLWKALEVKFGRILAQSATTKDISIPSLLQDNVGETYADSYTQAIFRLVDEAKRNFQTIDSLKDRDQSTYHEQLTVFMKKTPYFICALAGIDVITKALVS